LAIILGPDLTLTIISDPYPDPSVKKLILCTYQLVIKHTCHDVPYVSVEL
jgi:hypothetical protein